MTFDKALNPDRMQRSDGVPDAARIPGHNLTAPIVFQGLPPQSRAPIGQFRSAYDGRASAAIGRASNPISLNLAFTSGSSRISVAARLITSTAATGMSFGP